MATVLVVDDRADNREALATLLGYHGHRVLQAGQGREALEIARRERPALIISDIAMPVMDGFDLAAALHADPATAGITFAFYTAVFHEEQARNLARDCGVDQVLMKPSDPATILGLMRDSVHPSAGRAAAPPAPSFAQQHLRLVGDTLVDKLAELEASNVRLSALLQFSRELAQERAPPELLEFAAAATRRLSGAPSAAVYLRGADGDDRFAAASRDPPTGNPFDWPETIGGHHHSGGSPGAIRSVPIPEAGGVSGRLCIAGMPDDVRWAEQQRPLIAGIAGLLTLAYQSALQRGAIRRHAAELERQVAERTAELRTLNERLELEAISDPLTGVYNRRYMVELLEREFSRARRSGAPLAFLLADIDHFKRINDTFGHPAGDAALREIAAHLGAQIRREDALCRYGGEEFLIVLGGVPAADALRRAEGIRRAIGALAIDGGGSPIGPITLSIGVAIFPDHGERQATVLAAADQALYGAKSAGRNRCVLAARAE